MAYFLTLLLFCSANLSAKDFGVFGATFVIQEEDLIVVLQERLAKAKLEEKQILELQDAFIESVKNPKGKKLPKAIYPRIFEFDPTLCMQEDIKDQDGKIIVSKGMQFNPLNSIVLRNGLLFFDGNDKKQLAWAKQLQGLWVLTAGNPLEVESRENRPVYFDQAGYLTSKLKIESLPARVTQKGLKLKIEEIPCF